VKTVVLAAGRSTRTYPLTLTRPKPLLPLLNRQLLDYNLRVLFPVVEGFILVVGYYADMIKTVFGDDYRGTPIEYAYQTEQLGTADAVLVSEGFVNDDFLLLNGDDIYSAADLKAVVAAHGNIVLGAEVTDSSRFGMLVIEGSRLIKITEKPEIPTSGLANAGLYRLTPDIFDYVKEVEPSPRGEFEFVDAITALAGARAVETKKSTEGFLSIGTATDLIEAQKALWSGGLFIEGWNCRVAPSASIGPAVTIGNSCTIGGDVSLSNSIIFDEVNIGGEAKVKDSVLGSNVEVGEGAVLEAATVGDSAIIGPRAYLGPGSGVWPRVAVPTEGEISGEYQGNANN
jgi:NDP-sugar pyrophosphorylase family protein